LWFELLSCANAWQMTAGVEGRRGEKAPKPSQDRKKPKSTPKVKFCMYHLQGVCRYTADECQFAHTMEEMQGARGKAKPSGLKAPAAPQNMARGWTEVDFPGGARGPGQNMSGIQALSDGLPVSQVPPDIQGLAQHVDDLNRQLSHLAKMLDCCSTSFQPFHAQGNAACAQRFPGLPLVGQIPAPPGL
ncbi:unnamed protein product, partial [Effrenium voratum]